MVASKDALGEWLGTPGHARHMTILLVSLFVYAFAYHSLDASLPFISDEINKSTPASDTAFYGELKSVFGIFQFLGTILVGRAGDVLGGKVCLVVAQLASFSNYGLVAIAHSQLALFVSMIPTLLQQAYMASIMVVATLAHEDNRTKAFGRLTLGYGAGAILGPLVAGHLAATLGERGAVSMSCTLSLVISIVIFITLPNSAPITSYSLVSSSRNIGLLPDCGSSSSSSNTTHKGRCCSILSCAELGRLMRLPNVPALLFTTFMFNFSRGLILNILPQLAVADFQMTSPQVGELLSYNELMSLLSNGLLLGCLLDNRAGRGPLISERTLIIVTMVFCGLSLAALGMSDSVIHLFIAMGPVIGSNMVNTVISSLQTQQVPEADSGGVIGLTMASMTMSGILTPLLGAHLYGKAGLPAVCVVAACGMFVSAAYASWMLPHSGRYVKVSDQMPTAKCRDSQRYQGAGNRLVDGVV